METAKGTDLPDLLEHLGYTVRRLGSRYHTTREMDSLRIKDRRTWKRYSNGTGGDAITFLQEFCGKDFREAVNYLLEFNGGRARDSPIPHPKPVQKKEKPVFTLPIAHADQRRVFAYLQKRGISAQVIRGFIDSGLLYEDSLHHNCVFVGRDGNGKPVFASKRGTYDLGGSSFKRDAPGSDKSVAFRLPCDPALDWVAVFEAPIDLMSFCTLHRQVRSNAVALCGLYQGPLDTYLRENPHLKRIVLCLDADGQLEEVDSLLNDFNRELSGYISQEEFDGETFSQVEKRLDVVRSIKAKYGKTTAEVQAHRERITEKLIRYEEYDSYRKGLQEERQKEEKKLKRLSGEISKISPAMRLSSRNMVPSIKMQRLSVSRHCSITLVQDIFSSSARIPVSTFCVKSGTLWMSPFSMSFP